MKLRVIFIASVVAAAASYGTKLSSAEKQDLTEYLKTL
jgi:hypothetical protein